MNLTHNEKEKNIKNSPLSTCNVGDLGSIPGLGRSPGEYPLQYSGLKNSMDCIGHGVTKSQTRLSDFHFHFECIPLSVWLCPWKWLCPWAVDWRRHEAHLSFLLGLCLRTSGLIIKGWGKPSCWAIPAFDGPVAWLSVSRSVMSGSLRPHRW